MKLKLIVWKIRAGLIMAQKCSLGTVKFIKESGKIMKVKKADQILMHDVITEQMMTRKVLQELGRKGGSRSTQKQWEQRFSNLDKMREALRIKRSKKQ